MTSNEVERFEDFLWESFSEGVGIKELRISDEEKEYIKVKYPGISIRLIPGNEYLDKKTWFEVAL